MTPYVTDALERAWRTMRPLRQDGVALPLDLAPDRRTTRYFDVLFQPFDDGAPGMALIGLDNTEQHRRREGTRFIAEAGRLLTSSLDFETTLQNLADLAVPRLADWCAVEVVRDDGTSEQLAVAHADPEKVRYARALRERYPPAADAPHGVPHMLRTGAPEVYVEVREEMVRASALDEEQVRISLALGLRSAIIMPLVARGRVLGAITLVYAEGGRRYDEIDVEIASEIATRAAVAVDNARLYGEAQRAVRVRDDFLSVASHELRTPLTSMHLLVGGVLRKLDSGAKDVDPGRLRRLDAQLFRLAALIEQLLDVARLNAGRFQLHAEDVRLRELLDEVVDRFRDQAGASGVAVSLDGADDVVGCWDPQRLDQPGHRGVGPRAHLRALRARRVVAQARGPRARALDRAADGRGPRRHAARALGSGSRRHLRRGAPGLVTTGAPMTDSSSVLVVDDDDDIRQTLRDLLEDEGYRVQEARNGREALTRLRDADVCVVLLDLMMPVMDGWEFRQEQLSDPAIKDVPVVVITACGRTDGGLGQVDVLHKPLRVERILEAVASRC